MGQEVSPIYITCSIFQFNLLFRRTPYAILDNKRCIIAVLARHPYLKNGILDGWNDIVARACAAIEAACEEMHFNEDDLNH
jgi:hypothetical protein